jgi:DNA-binding transcriptional ArsR family regulator
LIHKADYNENRIRGVFVEEQIVSMKSDFFKALAHPTRVRILERLAQTSKEVCVCELIKDLGVEQSNLSQHLSILRKQQIITSTKVGLKVMYRVKYPEVLTILEKVQTILSQQFQEGEALMRHLADR